MIDYHAEVVEAVGEQEAERLIVQDMGSARAVYEHLVSIGSIGPERGEMRGVTPNGASDLLANTGQRHP